MVMKMGRRILAVLTALCVAAGVIAWPEGTKEVRAEAFEDFEYAELTGRTVEITKYTGADAEVVIPDEIDGKTVVSIGESAFEDCSGLVEITISSKMTDIKDRAFYNCENLTRVEVPDNYFVQMSSIGNYAFSGCTKLSELADRILFVKSVGDYAFSGCIGLTEIWISEGSLTSLTIGEGAFLGCSGLTNAGISAGGIEAYTLSIGRLAFSDCTSLSRVDIYGGTVSMGDHVFQRCSSLVEVDLTSSGAMNIADGTFSGCTALERIGFPDNMKNIGEQAFQGCKVLRNIILPSGVERIGDMAFAQCLGLMQIRLSSGISSIEDNAFQNCMSLKDVYCIGTQQEWENTQISTIGNEHLTGASIHYLDVDDSMNNYDYKVLSDGTLEILKYKKREEVLQIPEQIYGKTVSSIGFGADLEAVTTNTECKMRELRIPSTVVNIGELEGALYIGYYPKLETIYVDENNPAFSSDNGILFDKQQSILYKYPEAKGGEYDMPSSITSIKSGAFNACQNLERVRISSNVSRIDAYTFAGCQMLRGVEIPEGIGVIGEGSFQSCNSLESIDLPVGVTEIHNGAFIHCTKLKDITIPENVSKIESSTFVHCELLKQITIPASVAEIEGEAFDGCWALEDVYYNGTLEQWMSIRIDEKLNTDLLDAVVHFSDGTIFEGSKRFYKYKDLDDGTIEITGYEGSNTKVDIPATINGKRVTSIGNEAFLNNTTMTEITIPESVEKLGNLEDGVLGCFGECQTLKTINVHQDNQYYSSVNGVLFSKQQDVLIRYPAKKGGTYTVPSSVKRVESNAFADCTDVTKIELPSSVNSIGLCAFGDCESLAEIVLSPNIEVIEASTFSGCKNLNTIEIPQGVKSIGEYSFMGCTGLASITIPASMEQVKAAAFSGCSGLEDVYYSGIKSQWDQINIAASPFNGEENANASLLNAVIHFSDGSTLNGPEETVPEEVVDARQELEKLKDGDPFSLETDFSQYMTAEQIDVIESCLYTWLAEIDYAYKYSGSSGVKERVMKRAGIDPNGDFASGTEQAVTHICVETQYGTKTLEIILDLGKPDGSGSLYPAYGSMHYEVLEKGNLPSSVPKSGQIGKDSYTDMAAFIKGVKKASEDSLHNTYEWQSLGDEITACVLIDKTAAEIIGNKNGSFFDGTFTVYAKPLFTYHKIVKVSGTLNVNVYVYSMDGREAGSVVDNVPSTGNQGTRQGRLKTEWTALDEMMYEEQTGGAAADVRLYAQKAGGNVQIDVSGSTKTVYLAGDDYYLKLQGTGTGKMNYEVEEIANEEVRRSVQFLELQLEKDMQYDGYVFRPLNIDRDTYALRTSGSEGEQVIYANKDSYRPGFQKIQQLSISQQGTSLSAGRTMQLSVSFQPSNASKPDLEWTSDNGSVASVDGSGMVTASGGGRATITVSTTDGSFLSQSCMVEVSGGSGSGGNGSGGSGAGSSDGMGSVNLPAAGDEDALVVVNLHYIVQFHANGGTDLSRRTMTLLKDDSPGIMPKVRRREYLFDGWYTEQDGGTQVSGDKPLNEAATLYAHWTKVTAPAAPVVTLKSKKKGQLQAAIGKSSGAVGYEIDYSLKKDFSSAKTKRAGAAVKTKSISGLKAGKKYYVRVRAYAVDSMKNRIYGDYSEVKSVKVKKK